MDITQLDLRTDLTTLIILLVTVGALIISALSILYYKLEPNTPPLELSLLVLIISSVILSSSLFTKTEQTVGDAIVVQNTNDTLILKNIDGYASIPSNNNNNLQKGDLIEIKQVNWKIGYLFKHTYSYKIKHSKQNYYHLKYNNFIKKYKRGLSTVSLNMEKV